jgi:6,7-dimethyl-8-ribityllumazine synthase
MPHLIEGSTDATGMRFAIVASRFNDMVTRELLDGALETLREHGVPDDALDVAWCPGAFEVPLLAQRMAETGRYSAVITVGAVIRGETGHYDVVAEGVASGILQASLKTGVPIMFGVLTVDTLEQAFERAGGKMGNKGAESALGAIELARVLEEVDTGGRGGRGA